jgi:hypothetical protein
MGLTEFTLPALSGLAMAVATFGVCHWRHARRLRAVLERMAKLDAARLAAGERALQARRQIEQLQKELAEQRHARSQSPSGLARPASGSIGTATADIPVELPAQLPANGFADTLPICVRPASRPVVHAAVDKEPAPQPH